MMAIENRQREKRLQQYYVELQRSGMGQHPLAFASESRLTGSTTAWSNSYSPQLSQQHMLVGNWPTSMLHRKHST
jgi:hypothetical protein